MWFYNCHPPRQGHPGIICNLSSPNFGPQVGLEWTDHYATQYNLRTGWPLNSEPVCRSGSWTPKESIPPILPQLKVELHDDQTFLMKNCFLAYCLLSSEFFLLSSIFYWILCNHQLLLQNTFENWYRYINILLIYRFVLNAFKWF